MDRPEPTVQPQLTQRGPFGVAPRHRKFLAPRVSPPRSRDRRDCRALRASGRARLNGQQRDRPLCPELLTAALTAITWIKRLDREVPPAPCGNPAPMSASTSTIRPSSPTSATNHAHADATQPTARTCRPMALTRHHHHNDRVQPDSRCRRYVAHPQSRQLPQRPHLRRTGSPRRMAKTSSHRHDQKTQGEAVCTGLRGDNVNLLSR